MSFVTPILVATPNGHAAVILQEIVSNVMYKDESISGSPDEDGTKRCVIYEIDTSIVDEKIETEEIPMSSDSPLADDDFEEEITEEPVSLNASQRDNARTSTAKTKVSHKCSFEGCGKIYKNKNHLTVHMRKHTGERPFKCTFESCGKSFANSYSFKSHTRIHTNERPYKCEFCQKGFITSSDFVKHSRVHSGIKPFSCSIEGCNKSFTTSDILKVHIRTHTGERPFVCSHENCGKSFYALSNYKNHTRTHSGEKPFVCDHKDCGRSFSEHSSLHKHRLVHTLVRPFTCELCRKTFRRAQTLAMHLKGEHSLDVTTESLESGDLVLDLNLENSLELSEKMTSDLCMESQQIILLPVDLE